MEKSAEESLQEQRRRCRRRESGPEDVCSPTGAASRDGDTERALLSGEVASVVGADSGRSVLCAIELHYQRMSSFSSSMCGGRDSSGRIECLDDGEMTKLGPRYHLVSSVVGAAPSDGDTKGESGASAQQSSTGNTTSCVGRDLSDSGVSPSNAGASTSENSNSARLSRQSAQNNEAPANGASPLIPEVAVTKPLRRKPRVGGGNAGAGVGAAAMAQQLQLDNLFLQEPLEGAEAAADGPSIACAVRGGRWVQKSRGPAAGAGSLGGWMRETSAAVVEKQPTNSDTSAEPSSSALDSNTVSTQEPQKQLAAVEHVDTTERREGNVDDQVADSVNKGTGTDTPSTPSLEPAEAVSVGPEEIAAIISKETVTSKAEAVRRLDKEHRGDTVQKKGETHVDKDDLPVSEESMQTGVGTLSNRHVAWSRRSTSGAARCEINSKDDDHSMAGVKAFAAGEETEEEGDEVAAAAGPAGSRPGLTCTSVGGGGGAEAVGAAKDDTEEGREALLCGRGRFAPVWTVLQWLLACCCCCVTPRLWQQNTWMPKRWKSQRGCRCAMLVLLIVSLVLVIFLPIFFSVLMPHIIAAFMRRGEVKVLSTLMRKLRPDGFEAAVSLKFLTSVPVHVQVADTQVGLFFRDQHVGHAIIAPFSLSRATDQATLLSDFHVQHLPAWERFLRELFTRGKSEWRMDGTCTVKFLGLTYRNIPFNKVLEVEGPSLSDENGKTPFNVKEIDMSISTPTAIVAKVYVEYENSSTSSVESIGQVQFVMTFDGHPVGLLTSVGPIGMKIGTNLYTFVASMSYGDVQRILETPAGVAAVDAARARSSSPQTNKTAGGAGIRRLAETWPSCRRLSAGGDGDEKDMYTSSTSSEDAPAASSHSSASAGSNAVSNKAGVPASAAPPAGAPIQASGAMSSTLSASPGSNGAAPEEAAAGGTSQKAHKTSLFSDSSSEDEDDQDAASSPEVRAGKQQFLRALSQLTSASISGDTFAKVVSVGMQSTELLFSSGLQALVMESPLSGLFDEEAEEKEEEEDLTQGATGGVGPTVESQGKVKALPGKRSSTFFKGMKFHKFTLTPPDDPNAPEDDADVTATVVVRILNPLGTSHPFYVRKVTLEAFLRHGSVKGTVLGHITGSMLPQGAPQVVASLDAPFVSTRSAEEELLAKAAEREKSTEMRRDKTKKDLPGDPDKDRQPHREKKYNYLEGKEDSSKGHMQGSSSVSKKRLSGPTPSPHSSEEEAFWLLSSPSDGLLYTEKELDISKPPMKDDPQNIVSPISTVSPADATTHSSATQERLSDGQFVPQVDQQERQKSAEPKEEDGVGVVGGKSQRRLAEATTVEKEEGAETKSDDSVSNSTNTSNSSSTSSTSGSSSNKGSSKKMPTATVMDLTFEMKGRLGVTDGGAAFGAFMREMASQEKVKIAFTETHAKLAIQTGVGTLRLKDVQLDGEEDLEGMASMRDVKVDSFDIIAEVNEGRTWILEAFIRFPPKTPTTVYVGDLGLNLSFEGVPLGCMAGQNIKLEQGGDSLRFIGILEPPLGVEETVSRFFSAALGPPDEGDEERGDDWDIPSDSDMEEGARGGLLTDDEEKVVTKKLIKKEKIYGHMSVETERAEERQGQVVTGGVGHAASSQEGNKEGDKEIIEEGGRHEEKGVQTRRRRNVRERTRPMMDVIVTREALERVKMALESAAATEGGQIAEDVKQLLHTPPQEEECEASPRIIPWIVKGLENMQLTLPCPRIGSASEMILDINMKEMKLNLSNTQEPSSAEEETMAPSQGEQAQESQGRAPSASSRGVWSTSTGAAEVVPLSGMIDIIVRNPLGPRSIPRIQALEMEVMLLAALPVEEASVVPTPSGSMQRVTIVLGHTVDTGGASAAISAEKILGAPSSDTDEEEEEAAKHEDESASAPPPRMHRLPVGRMAAYLGSITVTPLTTAAARAKIAERAAAAAAAKKGSASSTSLPQDGTTSSEGELAAAPQSGGADEDAIVTRREAEDDNSGNEVPGAMLLLQVPLSALLELTGGGENFTQFVVAVFQSESVVVTFKGTAACHMATGFGNIIVQGIDVASSLSIRGLRNLQGSSVTSLSIEGIGSISDYIEEKRAAAAPTATPATATAATGTAETGTATVVDSAVSPQSPVAVDQGSPPPPTPSSNSSSEGGDGIEGAVPRALAAAVADALSAALLSGRHGLSVLSMETNAAVVRRKLSATDEAEKAEDTVNPVSTSVIPAVVSSSPHGGASPLASNQSDNAAEKTSSTDTNASSNNETSETTSAFPEGAIPKRSELARSPTSRSSHGNKSAPDHGTSTSATQIDKPTHGESEAKGELLFGSSDEKEEGEERTRRMRRSSIYREHREKGLLISLNVEMHNHGEAAVDLGCLDVDLIHEEVRVGRMSSTSCTAALNPGVNQMGFCGGIILSPETQTAVSSLFSRSMRNDPLDIRTRVTGPSSPSSEAAEKRDVEERPGAESGSKGRPRWLTEAMDRVQLMPHIPPLKNLLPGMEASALLQDFTLESVVITDIGDSEEDDIYASTVSPSRSDDSNSSSSYRVDIPSNLGGMSNVRSQVPTSGTSGPVPRAGPSSPAWPKSTTLSDAAAAQLPRPQQQQHQLGDGTSSPPGSSVNDGATSCTAGSQGGIPGGSTSSKPKIVGARPKERQGVTGTGQSPSKHTASRARRHKPKKPGQRERKLLSSTEEDEEKEETDDCLFSLSAATCMRPGEQSDKQRFSDCKWKKRKRSHQAPQRKGGSGNEYPKCMLVRFTHHHHHTRPASVEAPFQRINGQSFSLTSGLTGEGLHVPTSSISTTYVDTANRHKDLADDCTGARCGHSLIVRSGTPARNSSEEETSAIRTGEKGASWSSISFDKAHSSSHPEVFPGMSIIESGREEPGSAAGIMTPRLEALLSGAEDTVRSLPTWQISGALHQGEEAEEGYYSRKKEGTVDPKDLYEIPSEFLLGESVSSSLSTEEDSSFLYSYDEATSSQDTSSFSDTASLDDHESVTRRLSSLPDGSSEPFFRRRVASTSSSSFGIGSTTAGAAVRALAAQESDGEVACAADPWCMPQTRQKRRRRKEGKMNELRGSQQLQDNRGEGEEPSMTAHRLVFSAVSHVHAKHPFGQHRVPMRVKGVSFKAHIYPGSAAPTAAATHNNEQTSQHQQTGSPEETASPVGVSPLGTLVIPLTPVLPPVTSAATNQQEGEGATAAEAADQAASKQFPGAGTIQRRLSTNQQSQNTDEDSTDHNRQQRNAASQGFVTSATENETDPPAEGQGATAPLVATPVTHMDDMDFSFELEGAVLVLENRGEELGAAVAAFLKRPQEGFPLFMRGSAGVQLDIGSGLATLYIEGVSIERLFTLGKTSPAIPESPQEEMDPQTASQETESVEPGDTLFNTSLQSFNFDGPHSEGGMRFIATAKMSNSMPVTMPLPPLLFALYYKEVMLGHAWTPQGIRMQPAPKATKIRLRGHLLRQTDARGLSLLNELAEAVVSQATTGNAQATASQATSTEDTSGKSDGAAGTSAPEGLRVQVIPELNTSLLQRLLAEDWIYAQRAQGANKVTKAARGELSSATIENAADPVKQKEQHEEEEEVEEGRKEWIPHVGLPLWLRRALSALEVNAPVDSEKLLPSTGFVKDVQMRRIVVHAEGGPPDSIRIEADVLLELVNPFDGRNRVKVYQNAATVEPEQFSSVFNSVAARIPTFVLRSLKLDASVGSVLPSSDTQLVPSSSSTLGAGATASSNTQHPQHPGSDNSSSSGTCPVKIFGRLQTPLLVFTENSLNSGEKALFSGLSSREYDTASSHMSSDHDEDFDVLPAIGSSDSEDEAERHQNQYKFPMHPPHSRLLAAVDEDEDADSATETAEKTPAAKSASPITPIPLRGTQQISRPLSPPGQEGKIAPIRSPSPSVTVPHKPTTPGLLTNVQSFHHFPIPSEDDQTGDTGVFSRHTFSPGYQVTWPVDTPTNTRSAGGTGMGTLKPWALLGNAWGESAESAEGSMESGDQGLQSLALNPERRQQQHQQYTVAGGGAFSPGSGPLSLPGLFGQQNGQTPSGSSEAGRGGPGDWGWFNASGTMTSRSRQKGLKCVPRDVYEDEKHQISQHVLTLKYRERELQAQLEQLVQALQAASTLMEHHAAQVKYTEVADQLIVVQDRIKALAAEWGESAVGSCMLPLPFRGDIDVTDEDAMVEFALQSVSTTCPSPSSSAASSQGSTEGSAADGRTPGLPEGGAHAQGRIVVDGAAGVVADTPLGTLTLSNVKISQEIQFTQMQDVVKSAAGGVKMLDFKVSDITFDSPDGMDRISFEARVELGGSSSVSSDDEGTARCNAYVSDGSGSVAADDSRKGKQGMRAPKRTSAEKEEELAVAKQQAGSSSPSLCTTNGSTDFVIYAGTLTLNLLMDEATVGMIVAKQVVLGRTGGHNASSTSNRATTTAAASAATPAAPEAATASDGGGGATAAEAADAVTAPVHVQGTLQDKSVHRGTPQSKLLQLMQSAVSGSPLPLSLRSADQQEVPRPQWLLRIIDHMNVSPSLSGLLSSLAVVESMRLTNVSVRVLDERRLGIDATVSVSAMNPLNSNKVQVRLEAFSAEVLLYQQVEHSDASGSKSVTQQLEKEEEGIEENHEILLGVLTLAHRPVPDDDPASAASTGRQIGQQEGSQLQFNVPLSYSLYGDQLVLEGTGEAFGAFITSVVHADPGATVAASVSAASSGARTPPTTSGATAALPEKQRSRQGKASGSLTVGDTHAERAVSRAAAVLAVGRIRYEAVVSARLATTFGPLQIDNLPLSAEVNILDTLVPPLSHGETSEEGVSTQQLLQRQPQAVSESTEFEEKVTRAALGGGTILGEGDGRGLVSGVKFDVKMLRFVDPSDTGQEGTDSSSAGTSASETSSSVSEPTAATSILKHLRAEARAAQGVSSGDHHDGSTTQERIPGSTRFGVDFSADVALQLPVDVTVSLGTLVFALEVPRAPYEGGDSDETHHDSTTPAAPADTAAPRDVASGHEAPSVEEVPSSVPVGGARPKLRKPPAQTSSRKKKGSSPRRLAEGDDEEWPTLARRSRGGYGGAGASADGQLRAGHTTEPAAGGAAAMATGARGTATKKRRAGRVSEDEQRQERRSNDGYSQSHDSTQTSTENTIPLGWLVLPSMSVNASEETVLQARGFILPPADDMPLVSKFFSACVRGEQPVILVKGVAALLPTATDADTAAIAAEAVAAAASRRPLSLREIAQEATVTWLQRLVESLRVAAPVPPTMRGFVTDSFDNLQMRRLSLSAVAPAVIGRDDRVAIGAAVTARIASPLGPNSPVVVHHIQVEVGLFRKKTSPYTAEGGLPQQHAVAVPTEEGEQQLPSPPHYVHSDPQRPRQDLEEEEELQQGPLGQPSTAVDLGVDDVLLPGGSSKRRLGASNTTNASDTDKQDEEGQGGDSEPVNGGTGNTGSAGETSSDTATAPSTTTTTTGGTQESNGEGEHSVSPDESQLQLVGNLHIDALPFKQTGDMLEAEVSEALLMLPDKGDAFADVALDLLNAHGTLKLHVRGSTSVVVETALGLLHLEGLPLSVEVPVKGMALFDANALGTLATGALDKLRVSDIDDDEEEDLGDSGGAYAAAGSSQADGATGAGAAKDTRRTAGTGRMGDPGEEEEDEDGQGGTGAFHLATQLTVYNANDVYAKLGTMLFEVVFEGKVIAAVVVPSFHMRPGNNELDLEGVVLPESLDTFSALASSFFVNQAYTLGVRGVSTTAEEGGSPHAAGPPSVDASGIRQQQSHHETSSAVAPSTSGPSGSGTSDLSGPRTARPSRAALLAMRRCGIRVSIPRWLRLVLSRVHFAVPISGRRGTSTEDISTGDVNAGGSGSATEEHGQFSVSKLVKEVEVLSVDVDFSGPRDPFIDGELRVLYQVPSNFQIRHEVLSLTSTLKLIHESSSRGDQLIGSMNLGQVTPTYSGPNVPSPEDQSGDGDAARDLQSRYPAEDRGDVPGAPDLEFHHMREEEGVGAEDQAVQREKQAAAPPKLRFSPKRWGSVLLRRVKTSKVKGQDQQEQLDEEQQQKYYVGGPLGEGGEGKPGSSSTLRERAPRSPASAAPARKSSTLPPSGGVASSASGSHGQQQQGRTQQQAEGPQHRRTVVERLHQRWTSVRRSGTQTPSETPASDAGTQQQRQVKTHKWNPFASRSQKVSAAQVVVTEDPKTAEEAAAVKAPAVASKVARLAEELILSEEAAASSERGSLQRTPSGASTDVSSPEGQRGSAIRKGLAAFKAVTRKRRDSDKKGKGDGTQRRRLAAAYGVVDDPEDDSTAEGDVRSDEAAEEGGKSSGAQGSGLSKHPVADDSNMDAATSGATAPVDASAGSGSSASAGGAQVAGVGSKDTAGSGGVGPSAAGAGGMAGSASGTGASPHGGGPAGLRGASSGSFQRATPGSGSSPYSAGAPRGTPGSTDTAAGSASGDGSYAASNKGRLPVSGTSADGNVQAPESNLSKSSDWFGDEEDESREAAVGDLFGGEKWPADRDWEDYLQRGLFDTIFDPADPPPASMREHRQPRRPRSPAAPTRAAATTPKASDKENDTDQSQAMEHPGTGRASQDVAKLEFSIRNVQVDILPGAEHAMALMLTDMVKLRGMMNIRVVGDANLIIRTAVGKIELRKVPVNRLQTFKCIGGLEDQKAQNIFRMSNFGVDHGEEDALHTSADVQLMMPDAVKEYSVALGTIQLQLFMPVTPQQRSLLGDFQLLDPSSRVHVQSHPKLQHIIKIGTIHVGDLKIPSEKQRLEAIRTTGKEPTLKGRAVLLPPPRDIDGNDAAVGTPLLMSNYMSGSKTALFVKGSTESSSNPILAQFFDNIEVGIELPGTPVKLVRKIKLLRPESWSFVASTEFTNPTNVPISLHYVNFTPSIGGQKLSPLVIDKRNNPDILPPNQVSLSPPVSLPLSREMLMGALRFAKDRLLNVGGAGVEERLASGRPAAAQRKATIRGCGVGWRSIRVWKQQFVVYFSTYAISSTQQQRPRYHASPRHLLW